MTYLSIFLLSLMLSLTPADRTPSTLTLLTHDSFNLDPALIAQFEAQHNAALQILRAGDAGTMVNQAILTRSNPLADVLFGVDNTFLGRALEQNLFESYVSPLAADIAAAFRDEVLREVTPISYGDVCLNYDIAWFEEAGLPLPETLADLTTEPYRGLFVTMNPTTSSPGLVFLLTTIAAFGEEGDYTYLDFWRDLIDNEVLILDGWETGYFGHFSAVAEGGEHPLVLSYASSPPFTVDEATGLPTTGSIVADGMCFRQIEYAGVLAGARQPELAQTFIDFLLTEDVQASLPDTMFVFPVREGTELPPLFAEFAVIPQVPATLDPALIRERREAWLAAWLELATR